ncbi:MAG: DNA polymerase III subunit beta [Gammaproteobacteria bacterium]|nr:DNA polymerase III subunit beta [Gammaproteobacteria bacterium]
MKVTLKRSALLKPLQTISGVVERKQTMPILANVLLVANEQGLSLTATDTELELIGNAEVDEVAVPGSITVSARKLLDICRALPEDAVLHIEHEGPHVVLRSGRSRFLLATLPIEDFPVVENVSFKTVFRMSQARLKKLLTNIHFAMGQQDVRHYLNGALFDIQSSTLKCVATDGHRLAFSQFQGLPDDVVSMKVILPRKSVVELIRLLDANSEEDITISIGENHFRVQAHDFTFTSRLVSAQYPDYERLIPRQVQKTALADRETFRQALVRAAILSSEKFRGVRLQLDQDALRIIANNPEQEEAEETIHLEYQGSEMELGFNVAYLLDVLSAVGTEKIRCSFNELTSGVLFEPVEDTSSLYLCLYVVMPVRF